MEFAYSNVCFCIIEQKGNPLSVIDNWGALHKDKNCQWINDVARDKHDSMKKKKDEVREKLIQEAPEGTIFDSIQVPLEDEFGIMAENLGRKGKYVKGVGLFPRTDTCSCVSSMASSSELTDIRDQIKILSDGFLKLQQENEQLRAQLDLQNDDDTLGQTNNGSKESGDNNSSNENVYPELEEHDSEEE
ncbi:unnamed protein product [Malus baccata var. baccata]